MATTTELYNKLGLMIDDWNLYLDEQVGWLAGNSYTNDPTPPDNDINNVGKRYVTDAAGNKVLVWTPSSVNDIGDAVLGGADGLDARVTTNSADINTLEGQVDTLNLSTFAMSEADFFALKEKRIRDSAGSGFLEWGKVYADNIANTPINEGMWQFVNSSVPNTLQMGSSSLTKYGTSRTDIPLVNVNGVQHKIQYVGVVKNTDQPNRILFPDAEQGTRSYDSATGEVIDYLVDVDPKYGAVAADLNEAVARNFEGSKWPNGDFRNGETDWRISGTITSWSVDVNGIAHIIGAENNGGIGKDYTTVGTTRGLELDAGVEYEVKANVLAPDGMDMKLSFYHANHTPKNKQTDFTGTGKLQEVTLLIIPDALLSPSGLSINIASGDSVPVDFEVHNVSMRPVTNQPILSRQDFVFLESFHESMDTNDMFSPLGSTQYGANVSENGTPLVNVSTLVNQGYSAFGEWDEVTDGYCAKWSTMTDAQKKAELADPDNNIYLSDDGEYIQVKYRVRVVRGLGDEWNNVLPNYTNSSLKYDNTNNVALRGVNALTLDYQAGGSPISSLYLGSSNSNRTDTEIYTQFECNGLTNDAYNGNCFALPLMLVQR